VALVEGGRGGGGGCGGGGGGEWCGRFWWQSPGAAK